MKVREESFKVLLFYNLDTELKKINPRITRKTIRNGFSYCTPEKGFIYAFLYYPTKIRLHVYIGNKSVDGVTRFDDAPEWGVFILEKEEDLQKTLDIAKRSFELQTDGEFITPVYRKDKRDEPGNHKIPELKLLLKKYFSRNRKTPIRIKNIVIPLCLEHDIVTREMIKEKLVNDGEASNKSKAGLMLPSISGAIGRRDYLRQIITYERPYPWEKDNFRIVKQYRETIQELLENIKEN